MSRLRVAVDFGTSNTCAVMSCGPAPPQVVLVDGAPVVPSAVYAAADGGLFVGQEAQRQAAIDPSRYEPHPKRRIDEGELLLGDTVVPVVEVVQAVLARMVAEARRVAGGAPVDHLVLTHPADWGRVGPAVLRSAARPLAREVVLIPEPVAATLCYLTERDLPPAVLDLAVLDIGAGTVDASVVRRESGRGAGPVQGCTIRATRGDPTFGGADIDQVLLDHVGAIAAPTDPLAWLALVEGRGPADRRYRRALRADVRTAKETLSRHAYADVPLPPPFPDVHLTRADLERLIAPALDTVLALLEAVLLDAGYDPGQTPSGGVFLVGGSSRIPLVARLVHERLGIIPHILDVPETVVAQGAIRIVSGAAQLRLATTKQGHSRVRFPVTGDAPPRPATATHRQSPERGARIGTGALAAVVAGSVAVLTAALVMWALVVGSSGDEPASRFIAQYGYRFELLPGWEQTGGDADLREVRLAPSDAVGVEAVLVQENRLDYDSDAEPARPRRELATLLDGARPEGARPGRYAGFDPDAGFAGREVIYYRESPADGSTVDWYVLFQGRVQVSVGCRHTPATTTQVERACREVVRTLQIQ